MVIKHHVSLNGQHRKTHAIRRKYMLMQGNGCYHESALDFQVRIMEGSDMDEKKMEFGFDECANRRNGGRL